MTPTLRQHLETIQRYAKRIERMEPEHLGAIRRAAENSIEILDAATREEWGKGEGSDQHVFVLDPERVAS